MYNIVYIVSFILFIISNTYITNYSIDTTYYMADDVLDTADFVVYSIYYIIYDISSALRAILPPCLFVGFIF